MEAKRRCAFWACILFCYKQKFCRRLWSKKHDYINCHKMVDGRSRGDETYSIFDLVQDCLIQYISCICTRTKFVMRCYTTLGECSRLHFECSPYLYSVQKNYNLLGRLNWGLMTKYSISMQNTTINECYKCSYCSGNINSDCEDYFEHILKISMNQILTCPFWWATKIIFSEINNHILPELEKVTLKWIITRHNTSLTFSSDICATTFSTNSEIFGIGVLTK